MIKITDLFAFSEEISNLGFLLLLLLSRMASVCGRLLRSMFKIEENDDTDRENSFRTIYKQRNTCNDISFFSSLYTY